MNKKWEILDSHVDLKLSDLSIAELKKAIREYHALDYKKVSLSVASAKLDVILKHFISQSLKWHPPILYRARKHEGQSLFFNTSQLRYPENPRTLGRLNDIGVSIFYGASHQDTCIVELRPKVGDEITILESRLLNSGVFPELMEVGIRELMTVQNNNAEFLSANHQMLQKHLKTEESKHRYGLINKFLVNEITKIVPDNQTHKYKGTIAIGQFYINGNFRSDGMVYPSITTSGAECIALKPESYHKYYLPTRCFKCKIVSTGTINQYIILDQSIMIDVEGNITWSSSVT